MNANSYPNEEIMRQPYPQPAIYGAPQPRQPQPQPMPMMMPQGTAQPVQKPPKQETPLSKEMRGQFGFFGAATAIYALFYTFCLYKNHSGITFPFFVGGTLYFFCLCMKKLSIPLKKDAVFYIASTVLLGISTFLTDDMRIINMNYIAVFILLISFMLHHFYEDGKWSFSRYCYTIAEAIFGSIGCLGHPFTDFSKFRKEKAGEKKGAVLYVILGLLAVVPVFFIIVILLASADVVFDKMMSRIFDSFFRPKHIFGTICMFFSVFLFSYCFLSFLCKKAAAKEEKDKRTGEPVLAITFASVLSVVYVIFSMIQIVYLFFGQMELPYGYTYAEYARQGFFQLLFVCVMNLIMVLIGMYRFKESKILKGILTLISICTYIMIASSALRMIIYIKFYYLTFLRIFVLWSLAVIFLLMTGVLVTIYKNKFPLFRYSMAIVTIFYIVLAFSHPDYFIARCNVANLAGQENEMQQEEDGFFENSSGYSDISYLSSLSADAAPILLSTKETAFTGYIAKMDLRTEDMGLRNFNVSRAVARKFISCTV